MSNIAGLSRRAEARGEGASTVPAPKVRWRTRIVLPGAVLLVVGGLLAYGARDVIFPPMGVKVMPVVLREVGGMAATTGSSTNAPAMSGGTIQAPGWVEADPYATSVGALTDGILKEILVLEGQEVNEGQVVARMVADDAKLELVREEAELRQRGSDLKQAEARLAAAQANWDNPVERTRAVEVGEAVLAEARGAIVHLSKDIEAEKARAESLVQEVSRLERAMASGNASELELIKAKQSLRAQRATVEAEEAQIPVLEATVRHKDAELRAAKEHLRLRIDEAKELAQAKAEVELCVGMMAATEAHRDQIKLKLERMEIRSPISGVVMARLKEPGEALMFSSNMPNATQVLRVYDPRRLQVRVDVPLADAGHVGVGMKAKIVVGVLPEQTFDGEVTRIVHEADMQKNTLQVKVRIDKPVKELKPEMLARVKFVGVSGAGSATAGHEGMAMGGSTGNGQVVFAPESLIKMDGPHGSVWVVERKQGGEVGVARQRHVMKGARRMEGWVEIDEGLKAGDLLIATDHDKLTEGKKVRVTGEMGGVK